MRVAEDITKLIGHTPLVRLNRILDSGTNTIAAKLEQFNPCASIKDRPALGMIEDAERRGILQPGATIIEATSGNTGIALAFIAAARGYRLILTMPESMSIERRNLLKLFGVELELTPARLGMKGAIERADAIKRTLKDAFLVSQFDNQANPAIHEATTAEEIWADTDGEVDIIFCGVGTGGTLTGIGRNLKKRKSSIRVIAVEPASSPVLSGGACGAHTIQGLGAGFVPATLDTKCMDEVVKVTNEDAFVYARELARREGILAGLSSGAVVAGTIQYLKAHPEVQSSFLVLIFPDSGERYVSLSGFLKG
ncbi:MAG: cysteine synthase A [Acidobacteriota bacterium]|nr:cysteine synthase A [Acidobacteriota bacterium]